MNGHLAVIDVLRNSAAANYVGGSGVTNARIFAGDPGETEPLPYIYTETFDAEAFDTTSGAATTDHDLVKVFICDTKENDTNGGARTIAAASRTALDETGGTYNGYTVENIRYLRVDTYDVHLTNRRMRVHEQDYEVRIRV